MLCSAQLRLSLAQACSFSLIGHVEWLPIDIGESFSLAAYLVWKSLWIWTATPIEYLKRKRQQEKECSSERFNHPNWQGSSLPVAAQRQVRRLCVMGAGSQPAEAGYTARLGSCSRLTCCAIAGWELEKKEGRGVGED